MSVTQLPHTDMASMRKNILDMETMIQKMTAEITGADLDARACFQAGLTVASAQRVADSLREFMSQLSNLEKLDQEL